jgi:hypothetical protein
VLWQTNLGPSAATPTLDFGARFGAFSALVPEVGITGTPVIDLGLGTLFVDTFTHEGSGYVHRLHALSLTNGSERSFSPVIVSASVAGSGLDSTNGRVAFEARKQLQRCALTLADQRLYVAYAGYADTNPFHGWVLGYNATTLQLLNNYVFNSTPNGREEVFGINEAGAGGIWMGGGGLAVDSAGNLFFTTGNGSFNALNNSGGTEYGDTFLKLSTANGLAVADYFTPYNQQQLSSNDLDFGSGGVLLVPDQQGAVPHIMVTAGKQGKIYLLNRDQMTASNNHYNTSGQSDAVLSTLSLGGGVYDTPAWFNGHVYYAASADVLAAFSVSNNVLRTASLSTRVFPFPGVTPSISANGTNRGIVWVLQRSSPGVLVAYDATNLGSELYNSSQASNGRDQLTAGVKFAVPTVANGKVYVGGQNALSVFGLLNGPYAAWRSAHFGTNASNPTVAGDFADPDHDQVANLFEYAFAMDPNSADAILRPGGRISSGWFQLLFRRNLSATDTAYVLDAASNISGPWTNILTFTAATGWVISDGITFTESAASGSAPDEVVQVTITQTASPTGNRYFRLGVQRSGV